MLATALPRAGLEPELPLKLKDFIDTVSRVKFAKDNGCPWKERTLRTAIAAGAPLEVIKWALSKEQNCPWDDRAVKCAMRFERHDVVAHIRERFPRTLARWCELSARWLTVKRSLS